MSGFTSITQISVSRAITRATQTHLRAMGQRGFEGLALWAGPADAKDVTAFHVREVVIPKQRGLRSDLGVAVMVEGPELHRLNVWLYQQGLTIIAQIHSHPTEAYHSDMDDAHSLVTTAGGLSLVVPDFAVRPFNLIDCAVYRLDNDGTWLELSDPDVMKLITVVE